MKQSTVPGAANGSRRPGKRLATRGAAAALATVTAVSVAGMSSSPAQSAESTDCPETFPTKSLVKDQPVTGLTVSEGTTPEEFTGEILGVLDDGIAPGVDMIIARLTSAEIDRVGIWSGMSGSPVYAADGRLIGAVSYGLAFGPSPVAGLTPASQMTELLSDEADPDLRPARKVDMPQRIEQRVVASGAATESEAESGLAQLRLPLGLSGVSSQRRFDQLKKELGLPNTRLTPMGTLAEDDPGAAAIQAGGNLAAAISYGDITYSGVGTTTLVCGQEVVGFGHPMLWAGPTGLSLHPAEAIFVQEDPTFPGFKVANIGAPVGTIDEDRLTGIAGQFGAIPDTGDITTTVSSNTRERTGTTHVNLPEWMPDVAFTHLLSNLDRVFDGIGKGSSQLSYTIDGTREDGTPFQVTWADQYADPYDLTWATSWDLLMALYRLEYNDIEDVTIDSVNADSSLSRDYRHASITKVSFRQGGEWVEIGRKLHRIQVKAGKTALFKVELDSTGDGPASVTVEMPVKKREAGKRGYLMITGGNSGFYDEYYYFDEGFGGGGGNKTFEDIVESIEGAAHNDDVVAQMRFWGERARDSVLRERRVPTGIVVDGGIDVRVRVIG